MGGVVLTHTRIFTPPIIIRYMSVYGRVAKRDWANQYYYYILGYDGVRNLRRELCSWIPRQNGRQNRHRCKALHVKQGVVN